MRAAFQPTFSCQALSIRMKKDPFVVESAHWRYLFLFFYREVGFLTQKRYFGGVEGLSFKQRCSKLPRVVGG